jgi:hypothetical protein
MHELKELDQPLQYASVYVLPHRSVDGHEDKRHDGRCQCAEKMYLAFGIGPVGLHGDDLSTKQPFNKALKFMEFLKHFRSILKQIDPSIIAIIINETHAIILPSNRCGFKNPNI